MKYLSLFSGIGGFELGIERAFSVRDGKTTLTETKTSEQGVEPTPKSESHNRVEPSDTSSREPREVLCIGYSEIDKYAIKVYERHFNHENYGDITNITTLPDFDLLVGGFPCQAFSVAGKRLGFNETRGTLFFDIARILKDKRPRHLVLENVKGLLSHDGGKTFSTIIGVLTDLGYDVEWQVLNSKDFGVPQNRERVFIVGHLRGECGRKVFPVGERSQGIIKAVPQQKPQANISQTIDTRTGSYPKFGQYVAPVLTPDRAEKRQNGRRFKEDGDPSFTLTSQDLHGIYDGIKIRRLTPKECERLQGFPDNWTAGESDTQRYKMCGNAVSVPVVEAIMRNMCDG